MKCPKCGEEMADDMGICPYCGYVASQTDNIEKETNEMMKEMQVDNSKTSNNVAKFIVRALVICFAFIVLYNYSTICSYEKYFREL